MMNNNDDTKRYKIKIITITIILKFLILKLTKLKFHKRIINEY